jgi:hypothetical protein
VPPAGVRCRRPTARTPRIGWRRPGRHGHPAGAPRHHDRPLRQAAKDEVEAEELAGEGHGLWTARANPKTQARVGRTIDLAVDTCGFHFFDKDTGLAIGQPDINTTDGDGSAALRSV